MKIFILSKSNITCDPTYKKILEMLSSRRSAWAEKSNNEKNLTYFIISILNFMKLVQ